MKTAALLLISLFAFAGFVGSSVYPASAATCIQSGTPFSPIGTGWGTSSSPVSAGPGQQDVPLTVNILFFGTCTVTAATFSLGLSSPLSASNGKDYANSYEVNVNPGSILHETFYVNIASNASLKTYTLPLTVNYYSGNMTVLTDSFDVSVALKGNAVLVYTPSSTVLYAGQVNDLTLTIQNAGTGNASSISTSVSPSAQVGVLDQLGTVSELYAGNSTTETLELFVPGSASGSTATLSLSATYYDAYSNSETAAQVLSFEVSSVNPASPFVVESTTWGTSSSSPQPGDVNVPLEVSAEYMGTALVSGLKATLSLPSGFSGQESGSTASALVSSVSPSQLVSLTFYVDIGASVTPGTYDFGLSVVWSTATSSSLAESVTVSPPAIGSQPNAGASLSLNQLESTVVAGVPTNVTFVLSNEGAASIYSVSFSVNAPSPLVVMGNSPSPVLTVVQPGHNASYTVTLESSPSSTLGVYAGTVTVSYVDLDGNQHTQTYSVGLTLTGSIDIVVQDETVTQASSSVTVSGSLLNEGGASAYYLQVSGKVDNASANSESPDYVGEVDPNTPTPFTLVIPYSAPSTAQPRAQIELAITFQNSFGTSATSTSSSTTSLESASQLFSSTGTSNSAGSGSSGEGLVTIVSYSIIAVIAIAAVTATVLVGRRRAAMKPKKEDKVI